MADLRSCTSSGQLNVASVFKPTSCELLIPFLSSFMTEEIKNECQITGRPYKSFYLEKDVVLNPGECSYIIGELEKFKDESRTSYTRWKNKK